MCSSFPEKMVGTPRRQDAKAGRVSRDYVSSFLGFLTSWRSILVLILVVSSQASAEPATRPVLRVAADPNNLPFSNDRGEGFENKIAELVAREMDAKLEYVWHAQRRGFFRETLKSGDADVVMGVPRSLDM